MRSVDCCTGVEDSKARERAELIARDLIEYINSIDYQKYFDAMGRPGARGGDKEKQFSDFSIRAVDAAQVHCLISWLEHVCVHNRLDHRECKESGLYYG